MASEGVTLEGAQRDAAQLLKTIGITKIVFVDDEFADKELTVEELMGLLDGVDSTEVANLPHLTDIHWDSDPEIWKSQLREKWPELDAAQKSDIAKLVKENHSPEKLNDTLVAARLEDLLGKQETCEFKPLSLSEWNEQAENLLAAQDANSTCFLFDKDFRGEGAPDDEGLRLVQTVQQKNVGYSGLITHTVQTDGEYEAWEKLSNEHGLNRDKFILIAKQRLSNETPDYHGFLGMVRFAALSGLYAEIRDAAWDVFQKSVAKAKEATESLFVRDFDQIVMKSSLKEGVWEPDTLFRLFNILMRREARLGLYGNDAGMREKIFEARRVSEIPFELDMALDTGGLSPQGREIQHFENYESAEFLNGYCLPIDLGDIFEGGETNKKFILLAQPCDLMIRPDGRRGYDGKNGRSSALVEIVDDSSVALIEIVTDSQKPWWFELKFFNKDTGDSAYVDLAKVHQVQLVTLDLCALNEDGNATINVESDCPDIVIDPLKKRDVELKRILSTALRRHDALSDKGKEFQELSIPKACTTASFKADVNGKNICYKLRRVGRIRQPLSGALLTAFTQYLSRAAFEHDFEDR